MTSIGNSAFSGCSNLGDISVDERNTVYDSREGCNAVIETSSNTLVVGCAKTVIPEAVTSIGYGTFSGCSNLTAILIPKSVTSIGERALKNTSITYLTILGKPFIGEGAFNGCGQLTDIYCYSEDVPPAKEAFGNVNIYGKLDLSPITLHVPESAIEQYKNTEPWSRVGTIVAIK